MFGFTDEATQGSFLHNVFTSVPPRYDLINHVITWWLVSGNREAYRYLADSVLNYYGAEELQRLLIEAGFSRVTFRRLLLGAAAIHVAVK